MKEISMLWRTKKGRLELVQLYKACEDWSNSLRDGNAESMGKKGSWFSAIITVFACIWNEKPIDGPDRKRRKEKKKGRGILRHDDPKSFIPLFRKPSSIEKILGEADRLLIRPISPKAAFHRVSSPEVTSQKAPPPKAAPHVERQHLFATRIQAAYRGYRARQSFQAMRGLVRLQEVVCGQNVKQQTINALKRMQLLVRFQRQIQSRRIQMLENQAVQHQTYRNHTEADSTLSKWTSNKISTKAEAEENGDWKDSLLKKEEVEARMRKKVEVAIKRERSLGYAYSHKLWKSNPKSSEDPLFKSGFDRWCVWLDRQLPQADSYRGQAASTAPRPISEYSPSPRDKHYNFSFNNDSPASPRSSRSAKPVRGRHFRTADGTPPSSLNIAKYSRPRVNSPFKEDGSPGSCPPFSIPNYMASTASAMAKARANSNPMAQVTVTPRRFSFPSTPKAWSHSVGGFNAGPASAGRKPFDRFV